MVQSIGELEAQLRRAASGSAPSPAEAVPDNRKIEDRDARHAVAFLSLFMAGVAGRSGKKPNELHAEFEAAIAFGLLLAREQPRLAEAFADEWARERNVRPADFVWKMAGPYLAFNSRKADTAAKSARKARRC